MLRLTSGKWPSGDCPLSSTEHNDVLYQVQILYQSENFVVINKRFDLKINSDDPGDKITVATQLCSLYPNAVDKRIAHGFRFIHRLDYATSGCLCVALTKYGACRGNKAFAKRYVTKHYVALIRGHLNSDNQRTIDIDVPIGNDVRAHDIHKMCCPTQSTNNSTNESVSTSTEPIDSVCMEPRAAQTRIVLLELGYYDSKPVSKILLIPWTGRTHQLRVHCHHIGHAIVGDYTYSDRADVAPYRMMLHALHLIIPMKHETIDVISPDPFTVENDPLWRPTEIFQTVAEYSDCKEGSQSSK